LGDWTQCWQPCSVKKNTVAISKQVKIGCNLAESSKEAYGSKRVVLPMLIMMMLMIEKGL
jgi:hypothetical protein